MSGDTKTLAERVFDADLAQARAEHDLGDALDQIIPNDAWEHFTTDWYDRSIEVYIPVAPADPDGVARALFALDFSLVWIHPHPSPRGDCRCPVRSRPKAVPT